MISQQKIEEAEKEIMFNSITDDPVVLDRETFFAMLQPVLVVKKSMKPILDAVDTDVTYDEFIFYNKYPVTLMMAGDDIVVLPEEIIFVADHKLKELLGSSLAEEYTQRDIPTKTIDEIRQESESDRIDWPQYISRIVEHV